MPAPEQATYSTAVLAAAHTAFRDLIDAGGTGGFIKIRDGADVLLATIPLTYPCGTIDGATGQLVITPAGRDESADATGIVAYGEFCDSDGTVCLSLPAQAGSTQVPGKLVVNALSILEGGTVEVLSVVVG